MALVKNKLRNRLVCETVESILSVRYGLKFIGETPASFDAPREMLKLFTSEIYASSTDDNDGGGENLVFEDVYDALEALEGGM